MKNLLLLLSFLVASFSLPVAAQLRCDCSELTGDCSAAVNYVEGLVEITTDTHACAQVLFYIDGQPQVRLVTDGRDAHPRELEDFQQLEAGECRRCQALQISPEQQLSVVQQCEEKLLMPTDATIACVADCSAHEDIHAKKRCEFNCRRHSQCLDKHCVESLSKQLKQCERRCDRELQSSMAIDLDAFDSCQARCEKIKREISSCPAI